MHRWRLLPCLLLVAACGGGQRLSSDNGALLPRDPFDAGAALAPEGEPLAFGMRDGVIRNYFARQGPVAVHLLARSGREPRLIAAFPAGNAGIGIWFSPVAGGVELSAGAQPESEPSLAGGELEPVVYARGERETRGVRATLKASVARLSTDLVLLGSVRTLRDYGYGSCLEDATRFPALRNETIEPGPSPNTLRIRREQIGGEHSIELWLAGRSGTRLTLSDRTSPARAACPLGSAGGQARIDIEGDGGIELELVLLADDEPLTPIAPHELLAPAATEPDEPSIALRSSVETGPNLEQAALAFLSYHEKLLAGSWRFLTYFGRDTLLSLWLLSPALDGRLMQAAVGSVLERVQLDSDVPAPEGGLVARGDVAHEEEIGDYAAWKNSQLSPPPARLRQPRYDFKMVDDDYLLPPLLLALHDQLGADGASGARSPTRDAPDDTTHNAGASAAGSAFESFLARRRSDGRTYEEAALANLERVLHGARPFADDARPPREKAALLVALHENVSVGEWRDSEMGLAFGRYPFDVNAALVPAALHAAAVLYARLGRRPQASEARRLQAAWQGVEELFRFDVPLDSARANVSSYATALGLTDPSSSLSADADGAAGPASAQYAVALDRAQRPLPVVHSDHGFVLAFTAPPEPYLLRVAALLDRPFPAGLASPAGVLVANPGLADPGFTVVDARDPSDPTDDASTPLRELFSPAHYHGAVVWSWQQALLAKGLRRQLERHDLTAPTRAALEASECGLWRTIDATRGGSTRELWSWAPGADGRPELRPFGATSAEPDVAALADADESNAIQLWSTVYLAVRPPTPAQNPRCAAAGVDP